MNIFQLIKNNEKDLLEELLNSGVDVNQTNEFGQTPFHIATNTALRNSSEFELPRTDVLELLLEYNANPNQEDNRGRTAFDYVKTQNNRAFTTIFRVMITGSLNGFI